MKDDDNEAEVIELNALTPEEKPMRTVDLNRDVFANMGNDNPLETYSKMSDYLTKNGIDVDFYYKYEYKNIKMMSPDSALYDIAQCRVKPLDESVIELRESFNAGEELIWPPMAMVFDGEHVLAFGNTRYRALAECNGTNSIAKYAIIDPDERLLPSERKVVLSRLSSMSNVKSRLYAEPDGGVSDYAKQARNSWLAIKGLGGDSSGTHSALVRSELKWYETWDSAKTDIDKREVKREWIDSWMDEVKPNKYKAKNTRTQIFNKAFPVGDAGAGESSLLTEWGKEELKGKYDSAFSSNIEFNDVRNTPTNPKSMDEWHFYHPWGTNEGSVGNCLINLRNKIFTTLFSNNAFGKFKSVSLVITGHSGADKGVDRLNHVNIVMKGMQHFNEQVALTDTVDIATFPIVERVVFPQMLRSPESKVDRDFSYEWDASSCKFKELNKPIVDIVYTKRCSKCNQKRDVSKFGVCRSKTHKYKDALQPYCKECAKRDSAKRDSAKRAAS